MSHTLPGIIQSELSLHGVLNKRALFLSIIPANNKVAKISFIINQIKLKFMKV